MIVTEKKLDEIDKDILAYCEKGLTYKEIAAKLSITMPAVRARIREMKKWYQCNSLAQLVAKLKDEQPKEAR